MDSVRSAVAMGYGCSGANQLSALILANSPEHSGNKAERPAKWGN